MQLFHRIMYYTMYYSPQLADRAGQRPGAGASAARRPRRGAAQGQEEVLQERRGVYAKVRREATIVERLRADTQDDYPATKPHLCTSPLPPPPETNEQPHTPHAERIYLKLPKQPRHSPLPQTTLQQRETNTLITHTHVPARVHSARAYDTYSKCCYSLVDEDEV